MRFSVIPSVLTVLFLTACSLKPSGPSSVTLNLPSANQLNSQTASQSKSVSAQKINSANLNWSKACFMVNITGAGISSPTANKCDVPSGVFAGAVKLNSSSNVKVDLVVEKGNKRKIEVFAYFISSANGSCVARKSLNEFDPGSVASLGSTTVDIMQDKQAVDISISLPDVNSNLVSQFHLPALCTSTATALGDGSSRILTARSYGTTTTFKVDSVVTGLPTGRAATTTSGISVRLSHAAKDKDVK